jgi:hypothetical protein
MTVFHSKSIATPIEPFRDHSMKANSLPKGSSRQKSRAPCESVEQEFSRRFLSLFISAYDPSHSADPLDFPPAKPVPAAGEQAKPKSLASRPSPFDAAVWDIRLRKSATRRRTEEKEASDRIAAQLDFFTNLTAKPAPDIAPVFLPEPAPRPETPRYIANATADLEAEERFKKEKSTPLSVPDATAQWRSRVGRHEARKKARASQMRAYYANDLKAQSEFLKSLKVAEDGQTADWKPHPSTAPKH